jgi:glycosyltransferase involved in cell wall biosynthesis
LPLTDIALDATYAASSQPTGIGIYSQRLIAALAALSPGANGGMHRLTLCFRPGPYIRSARKMQWPPGCRLSPFVEFIPVPRHADLFHGLNQRLPGHHAYRSRVVTIHDLFPLTSAEYSNPDFQRHFSAILRKTIDHAHRIIAVSDATRRQLLRHTSAVDSKIRVVHHGVDVPQPASAPEQREFRERVLRLESGEQFFLSVGAIQVRKNVRNILLALRETTSIRLVLAGGEGHGAGEIANLIEREGLASRIVRLGHASMAQLRLLYSTALALVFPSLEEGFGFPILEAMSYGLPVLTSDCSSMPEVAGDAALLVNPLDVAEIAGAMSKLAEDEALRADLQRRGYQRAAQFTWQKCAQQTWAVYEEVL